MRLRQWKRLALITGATPVLLFAVVLVVVTNPVGPRRFSTAVEVQPAALRADVEGLIAAGGFRRWADVEGLDRAAAFIRSRWEAAGFSVSEQAFQVEQRTYRNLLVDYGPDGAPLVVVGAHYDVCGEQPGADDNASGVAGLLELARLLASHRPTVTHRVELVAYTLEEPPFFRTPWMGSAVHARSLAEAGTPVEAVVVLEMIGCYADEPGSQHYPSPLLRPFYPDRADFVAVVGGVGDWGLTRAVKARMAGACTVPVRSINAPAAVPGVDFSDHLNYWQCGFPAVMVSDTAFYRNANYHESTDTVDTLDLRRMAEVVKGVYAAVVTLD